jgi:methylenetetrahydrofolate dehydrogenase (NADP+)/methenyltetrahydrofolate cyclohydrolase
MTIILDGKKVSEQILDELKTKIQKLVQKPSLSVILVGSSPASEIYVGIKQKTAKRIGINSEVFKYSDSVEEKVVLDKIIELNNDDSVDAILVQMPLPKGVDSKKVIQTISPKKDVDGFTPENVGRLCIGLEPYAYPCTPKGVVRLLDEYNIELEGKHAVIVGRSNIVGKPLSQMLLNRDATVTICHSRTKNLPEITKTADILISAVGVNSIIKKDMIKPEAIVVDVGISKSNGKICGDVDFGVASASSCITPVPGGVGPMTIASLMSNTYELASL